MVVLVGRRDAKYYSHFGVEGFGAAGGEVRARVELDAVRLGLQALPLGHEAGVEPAIRVRFRCTEGVPATSIVLDLERDAEAGGRSAQGRVEHVRGERRHGQNNTRSRLRVDAFRAHHALTV